MRGPWGPRNVGLNNERYGLRLGLRPLETPGQKPVGCLQVHAGPTLKSQCIGQSDARFTLRPGRETIEFGDLLPVDARQILRRLQLLREARGAEKRYQEDLADSREKLE